MPRITLYDLRRSAGSLGVELAGTEPATRACNGELNINTDCTYVKPTSKHRDFSTYKYPLNHIVL